MPFNLRYSINNNKIAPFIEFGFSPYLYLITKRKEFSDSTPEPTIEKIKKPNSTPFINSLIYASFSLGLDYNINKEFALFIQPIVRYNFKKIKFLNGTYSSLRNNTIIYSIELGLRKNLGVKKGKG